MNKDNECPNVGGNPPVPSDPFKERQELECSLECISDSFGFDSVTMMITFAEEVLKMARKLEYLEEQCDKITP